MIPSLYCSAETAHDEHEWTAGDVVGYYFCDGVPPTEFLEQLHPEGLGN